MYRADISLLVLKLIGIWSPTSLNDIHTFYDTFSIFMFCVIYFFTTSTVLYLFQNISMEEFAESLFYVLLLVVTCCKMTVILLRHNKIFDIIEMLCRKEYEVRDVYEFHIQKKYDNIGRLGTIAYIISVIIAVTALASVPLAKNDDIQLPFKVWVPYSLDNRTYYWLTFLFHFMASMICALITVASDTFCIVMMLQICGQLEILNHRIQLCPQLCVQKNSSKPRWEIEIIGKWIQHHNSLYLFGKKLNDVFNPVFFIQLFATTLNVCSGAYLLATLSVTSLKFWSMTFSLTCVIFEISLYCWHGSMVMEKSMEITDAAYDTSSLLSKIFKKNIILFIMRRSSKPITFTAGSMVPLSIDTYNSILRLSYSIYNCIMQTS